MGTAALRKYCLAILLCGLCWFSYGQDATAAALAQRSFDLFDKRPAKTILIVGNSRTYYNRMPAMVREIADSAGHAAKLQIETAVFPGAYFKDHWANARTRRLIGAHWDEVVLQGASGEQLGEKPAAEFLDYGGLLAQAAKAKSGNPKIVVNWAYDVGIYDGYGESEREEHLADIRSAHRRLAQDAGLSRINVAGAWELIRLRHPSIRLTSDGNHPTVAGSYVYALAIYAALPGSSVPNVTYVPEGVSAADGEAIRSAVAGATRLDD